MSRILTVAKYLPAVLSGLLVLAWVLSWQIHFGLDWSSNEFVWIDNSDLAVAFVISNDTRSWPDLTLSAQRHTNYLGWLAYWHNDKADHCISLPIPFLLTLFLPLTIAPFTRFRFPLWSYFAFTALVAVELTYYLR
jgi:hypothetical protein